MSFLNMKEELIGVAYDPNQVQISLYNKMESLLNGNDIPDPTNPFMFLLESNATVGATLLEEMKNNIRKLYPSLANSKEDLYHHVYDREIENIFAYPSEGSFTISIAIQQIINYGVDKGKFYELIIPTFTKIIVKGFYKFMVLNDIVIRYYPNTNKTMVITMPSELSIGYIGDEVLESYLITDNNNTEWLVFNITIKQLDGKYIKEPVIPTNGYTKDINLEDQFNTLYSRATSDTLGNINLIPTFSDFVYDVKKPILKCNLKNDKLLNIALYDVFLANSDFNRIETLIFTTKGKLSTSFNNISKEEFIFDFSLVKDINKDIGSIVNVTPVIFSNSFINGGRDILPLSELKDIIINNTTGDNNLPITNYDLKERVSRQGYKLKEDMDSTLRRQYTVTKDLSTSQDNFVYSNPDVFLDTLEISHENITKLPDKLKIKDGSLIIEPFTFFYKDNYTFKPVDQTLVNSIKSMQINDLSEFLLKNKYFYNIYKYVCDFSESIDYRVYEVNTPSVTYIKSIYYNKELGYNVNFINKKVERKDNSYTVSIDVNIDNQFADEVDNGYVKAIFKFKPKVGSSEIVIDGTIDVTNKKILFTFDLDDYIDSSDSVKLINFSSVMDSVSINGEIKGKFFIYTTNKDVNNNSSSYLNEVLLIDSDCKGVISVFDSSVLLFKRIDYLYSNYRISPTLRLYERYKEDVYMTYEQDVYAKDENGDYILEDTEVNGETVKKLKVLHHKGDIRYDKDGNPLIKFKQNDVVIDENGKPVINYQSGYTHYLDILVFELEYLLTPDVNYKTFIINKYLELNNYLLTELRHLNAELLENTKITYRPNHTLKDVQVYLNSTIFNTPFNIKPRIVLYIIDDITDNKIFEELVRKLNILLQDAIKKYNNRLDMVKYISDRIDYDNIEYIKIENLDTIGELNIYSFLPDSNTFSINKKLAMNSDASYVPQLDFDLKIVRV